MSNLDRDRATPVASEISARPYGKQQTRSGKGDSEISNGGAARNDLQVQPGKGRSLLTMRKNAARVNAVYDNREPKPSLRFTGFMRSAQIS